MATVQDLLPGDVVTLGVESATFIASEPHPRYPHLRLVIWKLNNGKWSLDALHPHLEVGAVNVNTWPERRWNLIQEAFNA